MYKEDYMKEYVKTTSLRRVVKEHGAVQGSSIHERDLMHRQMKVWG